MKTTSSGLKCIKDSALNTTSKINFRESIRTFSGLRAIPDTKDFIIGEDKEIKGFIDVTGMKSPGLTSAPSIAVDIVKILNKIGKSRLEKVVIVKVDENKILIKGTEIEFKVDTLLLSVGLIPENELSSKAGIKGDSRTNG